MNASSSEPGCGEEYSPWRAFVRAGCRLGVAAALFGGLVAPGLAQTPHTHAHGFGDAARWSKVFDDPARDEWQKPHAVIEALGLRPNAIVADIGAGTGYFASRLAHMLPGGKVIAADVEPAMVSHLAGRAKSQGLANLVPVQSSSDDARLPHKVDLALFVDVYHHVDRRDAYLRRLRDQLAPGGRVAVIDFRMDAPIGPPRSERLRPEQVKEEFERAGYVPVREHGFLPYQYFLEFAAGGR